MPMNTQKGDDTPSSFNATVISDDQEQPRVMHTIESVYWSQIQPLPYPKEAAVTPQ